MSPTPDPGSGSTDMQGEASQAKQGPEEQTSEQPSAKEGTPEQHATLGPNFEGQSPLQEQLLQEQGSKQQSAQDETAQEHASQMDDLQHFQKPPQKEQGPEKEPATSILVSFRSTPIDIDDTTARLSSDFPNVDGTGNAEPEPQTGDDGELFVERAGEVKQTGDVIDLTEETEEESAARALRVAAIPWDLCQHPHDPSTGNALIKTEEESETLAAPVTTISADSLGYPESSTTANMRIKTEKDEKKPIHLSDDEPSDQEGEDIEHISGTLKARAFELDILQKMTNLRPRDKTRMASLEREISRLEERLSRRLSDEQPAGSGAPNSCSVPQREPAVDEGGPADDNGGNKQEATKASSAKAKRGGKRPLAAHSAEQPATKRPKKSQPKGHKIAYESNTSFIQNMLQNQSTIEAGQRMADMPVMTELTATTVKAQKKQLREAAKCNSDDDKQQRAGDNIMMKMARKSFAKKYKVFGDKVQIRGMNTTLLSYQFGGAGWMIQREKATEQPVGGILADAMGLGKTVQTLACIVGNPPTAEDIENGMAKTVIIVPANAVPQRMGEVARHCDGNLAAHYKPTDVINEPYRERTPIWITSYEEVTNQYPSDDKIRRKEKNPALTQSTKFLGHGLFELPRPHRLEDIKVRLSKEESFIYRLVEDKYRRDMSSLLAQSGDEFNSTNRAQWFNKFLRLRQAATHPFQLAEIIKKNFDRNDIELLIDQLKGIQTNVPLIKQVGRLCEEKLRLNRWLSQEENSMMEEWELPDDSEFLKARFDMVPPLVRYSKRLGDENQLGDICPRCGSEPQDRFQPESLRAEPDPKKRTWLGCRECNKLVTSILRSRPLPPPAPAMPAASGRGIYRGKGDDVNGVQPYKDRISMFLADSDKESGVLTPSAKTLVLYQLLTKWSEKYPDDKIILFISYVISAQIVGRMLQGAGIDFLYYFGCLNKVDKQRAIRDFRAKKNVRVLLSSLQCAGQVLNLECANRVILFDLWWNKAMEEQAFGRVYRMGQAKETYLVRIVVRNTVDKRLADMQDRKVKMIGQTIRDHDSAKFTKEDYVALLGRPKRNEHGELVGVEPDYEDGNEEEEEGEMEMVAEEYRFGEGTEEAHHWPGAGNEDGSDWEDDADEHQSRERTVSTTLVGTPSTVAEQTRTSVFRANW
ncbi:hypothetical protein VTJ49DRAFT_4048 [Mycothermus thermophilus]|uniref:Helicase C-terminal domain-containing protein n=1 Tax=Humicola insolens TaxID=85995 RepID=A0ABR3V6E2_HUMIN